MPSKTTAARSARSAPEALKLLTEDHKQVHARFVKYKKLAGKPGDADERQALAEEICMLLTVHATVEEEILYPAARAAGVDTDLLDEAEVEHACAKELIAQIRDMAPDDLLYDAKVTVLGEYIDHHVKEEQDELFPRCRKSAMDLQALGEAIGRRRHALIAEMSEGLEAVHG